MAKSTTMGTEPIVPPRCARKTGSNRRRQVWRPRRMRRVVQINRYLARMAAGIDAHDRRLNVACIGRPVTIERSAVTPDRAVALCGGKFRGHADERPHGAWRANADYGRTARWAPLAAAQSPGIETERQRSPLASRRCVGGHLGMDGGPVGYFLESQLSDPQAQPILPEIGRASCRERV